MENRYLNLVVDDLDVGKNKKKIIVKEIIKENTKIFRNSRDSTDEIDKDFAKLTHHKSLFLPSKVSPSLTLGTVIRSNIFPDKYYICIQQKCDSVRIYGENRKFLFLPLSIVEENERFQIVTPENIKLSLDKRSYSIRTIKFNGDSSEGVVKAAKQEDGKYVFNQVYSEKGDEQFEWILDLKDLHSQRIVSEYASLLSRVGLDESEWLRRKGF